MKRYQLNLIKTLVWVPLLLMFAQTSFAADTVLNINTGANSINNSKVNVTGNAQVAVTNNGVVTNGVTLDATTGGNAANSNTGNGSVTSGDVLEKVTVANTVNTTSISDHGVFSPTASNASAASAKNTNTGANSTNKASVLIANSVKENVKNDLKISNKVKCLGSTGHNTASWNTGDGSVASGDVSCLVSIKNIGNQLISVLAAAGSIDTPSPTANGKGGGVDSITLASAAGALPTAGFDSLTLALLGASLLTGAAIAIERASKGGQLRKI